MNWAVATVFLVGCVLAGVLRRRVVGQRAGRLVLQAALVATALVLFAPWLCVSTVAAGALLPPGYPEPPAVPDVCWTVLGLRLPLISAVNGDVVGFGLVSVAAVGAVGGSAAARRHR